MSDAPPKIKSKSESDAAADPAGYDTATPSAPKSEMFQPPTVDVGDIVQWHVYGTAGPGVPALVTRTNSNRTLALSVIKVGAPVFDTLEKEAVMHADDPRHANSVHLRSAGCWRLTQREERLRRQIAAVTARLDRIESKVH